MLCEGPQLLQCVERKKRNSPHQPGIQAFCGSLYPRVKDQNIKLHVGYEVLTVVLTKNSIFWDITPCGPFEVNQHSAFIFKVDESAETT
jgi:hypothetical protein